jgi:hypothetical protein
VGKKIAQALKERHRICPSGRCSASIVAALRAQSQGGEEFLGLRSSPGWCPVPAGHYNAIAPSALKRTYLLRNRRAESTRGNNPNAP